MYHFSVLCKIIYVFEIILAFVANRWYLMRLLISSALLSFNFAVAQQIIDPCFTSVNELGYFTGSEDLVNVCNCDDIALSSNLIQ